MNTGEIVIVLLGGSLIGALLTYLTATRDLALRRRMQTIDIFLRVAARAHGYADERGPVGLGEQVAAIYLMADLANRDKWLRKAGIGHLGEVLKWSSKSESAGQERIVTAVKSALQMIEKNRVTGEY
ncbi:hypothetical protein [Glutamicibacter sp. BW77]|uniref:hypothetical protein n=1 Tax=Glutamicibacter sp. BW77 TaxID=2024402 RepID=UPI0011435B2D|nr:hypothetical protein [Glutamicibacter sp. BW77]